MSARYVMWGVALVLALGSCKDEPTQPAGPGTLSVVLTTPNSGQDGAAVIMLTSPTPPAAVTAGAGLTLWGRTVNVAVDTIALTGPLVAGTILTLVVQDAGLVSQYRATLREVAASDAGVALRDLTGYGLNVTK